MAALAVLLALLTISVLVVRVATVALVQTGMSHEAAQFQARSAFTGTGFTTREAEGVVSHSARRRIIKALMLLRGAGITVAITTLILSFIDVSGSERLDRMLWLGGGCVVLWIVASNRWVDRQLTRWIRFCLERFSDLYVADFAELLRLSGEYRVRELAVDEEDWLARNRLKDLQLFREGVLVLGIHRPDGRYLGAPRGDVEVREGDTLVLYGRSGDLKELDRRREGRGGDEAHGKAIARQEQVEKEEEEDRDRNSGND